MRPVKTIALAVAIMLAGAAHAADTPPGQTAASPAPSAHPRADANGDGVITREEAKAFPMLDEQFDSIDTNKDGKLDAQEMEAHRAAMHEQMKDKGRERWKAADKDGNGSLSRAEAEASMPHLAQNFDKIDANGDGQISPDEMRNFHKAQDGRHSAANLQQKFAAADKNGDGALDLTEAKAGMPRLAEHFAEVDTNKDGKVSLAEIEAFHAHH